MNSRHPRRLGRDTHVAVQAQRSSLIFPLKGDNRKSIPRLSTVRYCTLLKRPRKQHCNGRSLSVDLFLDISHRFPNQL